MPKNDDYTIKNATSFCFGNTNGRLWEKFAIYFLLENAEIYSICPVVPFNWYALIPLIFINYNLIA
jgi:hypothetical protein